MENMTINEAGGKQHEVAERCEALMPRAILAVAALRAHGHDVDGYEDENYKLIPARVHLGRALRHILNWYAGRWEPGESPTDELVHACCRLMFAVEMEIEREEEELKNDELDALRLEFGYGKD